MEEYLNPIMNPQIKKLHEIVSTNYIVVFKRNGYEKQKDLNSALLESIDWDDMSKWLRQNIGKVNKSLLEGILQSAIKIFQENRDHKFLEKIGEVISVIYLHTNGQTKLPNEADMSIEINKDLVKMREIMKLEYNINKDNSEYAKKATKLYGQINWMDFLDYISDKFPKLNNSPKLNLLNFFKDFLYITLKRETNSVEPISGALDLIAFLFTQLEEIVFKEGGVLNDRDSFIQTMMEDVRVVEKLKNFLQNYQKKVVKKIEELDIDTSVFFCDIDLEPSAFFKNFDYSFLNTINSLESVHPGGTKYLQEKYNITLLHRYPMELLLKLCKLKNIENQEVILMITEKRDHNLAFLSNKTKCKEIESGNHINLVYLIYEYGNEEDLKKILKNLIRARIKIRFAVIGSHGNRYGFGLFNNDSFGESLNERISKLFSEKSILLLNSCSTGSEEGIASAISTKFRVKTLAPTTIGSIYKIKISITQQSTEISLNFSPKDLEDSFGQIVTFNPYNS
jgi:hypothetical protein